LSNLRMLLFGVAIGYGIGFLQFGRSADPMHKITFCAHEMEAKERAAGMTPDDDTKQANLNECAKNGAR
jgi:hypothetical protein